jgi:precorrin-6B methylase 1
MAAAVGMEGQDTNRRKRKKYSGARGSLTVVGTGYRLAGQITPEALTCIRRADRLFHVTDSITAAQLKQVNPSAESLRDCYSVGGSRMRSYRKMVQRMLAPVREGLKVCTAFYGHPGVVVYAGHEAIRIARREGHHAEMLPGISALDCLIADVGVDLALGCQSFDATDFLARKRKIDLHANLILWQIVSIGVSTFEQGRDCWNPEGFKILAVVLGKMYGSRHKVVHYRASIYPMFDPVIQRISLKDLGDCRIGLGSMLYVPPLGKAPLDMKMVARFVRH